MPFSSLYSIGELVRYSIGADEIRSHLEGGFLITLRWMNDEKSRKSLSQVSG
jgi:hypothetical protein